MLPFTPGKRFRTTALPKGFDAAMEQAGKATDDAARVRAMCDTDSAFGYALMRRLLGVVAGRLQSTRLQVTDMLSTAAKRAGA